MNKIAIIYHKADCDGICSAALTNLFTEGEKTFFPITYGEPCPTGILGFDAVYLLDFTFPKDTMKVWFETFGPKFVWIDHHEKICNEVNMPRICGMRRFADAACVLVWEFFSEAPVPEWVRLLGEWDMWRHTSAVLQFNAYCALYLRDPTNPTWSYLFRGLGDVEMMMSLGQIILDVEERYDNNALKRLYTSQHDGYTFAAINEACDGQVFKKYAGKVDIHIFYYRKADVWKVSIRKGNSGLELHCGDLAKRWGNGNGHAGASSMILDRLPGWLQ